MAGVAKLAPHIVLLGEALQPALRKVEAELSKTVRPIGRSDSFFAAGEGALACLGGADRLAKMMPVFDGVANAADVPAAQVHRAVGRLEMVLDDLLECYAELRQARPWPAHERGHELLVAAFRHTLRQIQGWLLDVVDAAADPMEVLKRKGLPTSGSVTLKLTLKLTAPRELLEFNKWAADQAARNQRFRFWTALAAVVAGASVGLSVGGDD